MYLFQVLTKVVRILAKSASIIILARRYLRYLTDSVFRTWRDVNSPSCFVLYYQGFIFEEIDCHNGFGIYLHAMRVLAII